MVINAPGKKVNKHVSNSAYDPKVFWIVECHADDKELHRDITNWVDSKMSFNLDKQKLQLKKKKCHV